MSGAAKKSSKKWLIGGIIVGVVLGVALVGGLFYSLIEMDIVSNARAETLRKLFPATKVAEGDFPYNPVITDVDGDGKDELIAGSSAELSCYREVDGKYKFARSIYAIGSSEDHLSGIIVKAPGVLLAVKPHGIYEIDLPKDACGP